MKEPLLTLKRLLFIGALFSVIHINTSYAQGTDITVSGIVADSTDSSPLPGVSIILKGTTIGTSTNADGRYTLTVPSDGILVFSFLGYVTQEVSVSGRGSIDLTLRIDSEQLDEVVVIGYQTVDRRDLTGATSVIKPSDANRVTATSVAESIQGLSPGVSVRNGGAPGQNAVIEIRGASSFTNTNPLYVIDGMIADANITINTNDIESIQILKDASAAAIYGSRAANGVIILTTKKGKNGDAKFDFSAKFGLQQIAKRRDVMNSSDFASMQRTQYENSGETPPPSVATDPTIDTDWQDEMIRTGTMEDYSLAVSGGSKTGNYFVSASYFKNDGVLIGYNFKRGSLRVNTSNRKGRFTFGENFVISTSYTNYAADGNAFYDMPQMLPVIPVKNDSYITPVNPEGYGIGTLDAITYAWNPVAVNNLSRGRSNYVKMVGNAYADVEIFDWLKYRFNVGTEVSFDYIQNLRKVGIWQYSATAYPSSINEERARYLSLLFENTLNFDKTFGDHKINGVIGYSQQHSQREFTTGGRTNLQVYNGQYMTTIGSALGDSNADGGRPVDYRIYGYLGRVNYAFADRYLLTLTGRIDQDSRFGSNYRTGNFFSVAGGWRISSESFFKVPSISNLKLTASYGQLGINPLGSWDYTAYINNAPRAIFGSGQTPNIGIIQAQLANPDLKWEERIVTNIGVDAGFFNNALSLSVAFYNSLSKDVLLQLPVGGYLGNLGGNPFINAGSIRNTGFEIETVYRNSNTDVKWEIGANATTINNTVENVGNRGESIDYFTAGNTRTKEGRSIGEWFLIKTDGLFQSQEEIDNYTNSEGTVIQPLAQPGDVKFIDKNDDGEINAEDRQFVASPWPKLQMGLRFGATYKGLSVNVQFVGVFGNQIYDDVGRVLDSYQRTNFRSDLDPWTPDNTNTNDPRIAIDTDQGIISNNRGDSDRWLHDGSYVRLRNIEIGYAIPTSWTDRVRVKNARIFVSGQNLFTITKYKGLDPDVVGNGLIERGLDNGNWPASRVYSAGIQFGF